MNLQGQQSCLEKQFTMDVTQACNLQGDKKTDQSVMTEAHHDFS